MKHKVIFKLFTIFILDEIKVLLPVLLSTNLLCEGEILQKEMLSILKLCQDMSTKIWPNYLSSKFLPGPIFEIVNISFVFFTF